MNIRPWICGHNSWPWTAQKCEHRAPEDVVRMFRVSADSRGYTISSNSPLESDERESKRGDLGPNWFRSWSIRLYLMSCLSLMSLSLVSQYNDPHRSSVQLVAVSYPVFLAINSPKICFVVRTYSMHTIAQPQAFEAFPVVFLVARHI